MNLQKALQEDPKSTEALELKEKIGAIQQLDRLTEQVKSDPQNEAAKQELTSRLEQAARVPIANPQALAKVALAQAAIGRPQEAASTAEKAIKISPNAASSTALKRLIAAPH
jgi:tetratricopeptide (TPR) repeat protein